MNIGFDTDAHGYDIPHTLISPSHKSFQEVEKFYHGLKPTTC